MLIKYPLNQKDLALMCQSKVVLDKFKQARKTLFKTIAVRKETELNSIETNGARVFRAGVS